MLAEGIKVNVDARVKNLSMPNKREEILEAAASLFRHQGFDGTSMQDIASAVGMLKGSLYYHFSSKEEILYEVVCKGINWLLAGAEPIARSGQSPMQKMRQLVERHARHLMENNDSIVIFSQENNKLSPQHRQVYLARRDRYEAIMREVLEEGMRTGEFAPADARLLVKAILGMLNWLIQWYRPTGRLSPDEIVQFFSNLVCDRLLPPR